MAPASSVAQGADAVLATRAASASSSLSLRESSLPLPSLASLSSSPLLCCYRRRRYHRRRYRRCCYRRRWRRQPSARASQPPRCPPSLGHCPRPALCRPTRRRCHPHCYRPHCCCTRCCPPPHSGACVLRAALWTHPVCLLRQVPPFRAVALPREHIVSSRSGFYVRPIGPADPRG